MADFTGYNPQEVEALGGQIKNAASKVSTGIVEKIKSGIVSPISEAWFSPEGVEFFEQFAQTVKSTGTEIEKAFNDFMKSVESAGNNWAQNVKGPTVALGEVGTIDMTLDVSSMKPDNGGQVGIMEAAATSVAGMVPGVKSDIESTLAQIAGSLEASSAFLGRGQASAVQSCFRVVNNAVAKIFNFLTDGDNSLQGQINKAVSKYGDIGTETASAFNSVQ